MKAPTRRWCASFTVEPYNKINVPLASLIFALLGVAGYSPPALQPRDGVRAERMMIFLLGAGTIPDYSGQERVAAPACQQPAKHDWAGARPLAHHTPRTRLNAGGIIVAMLLASMSATRTVAMGLYANGRLWRVHTNPARTEDEHYVLLRSPYGGGRAVGTITGLPSVPLQPPRWSCATPLAHRWLKCEPSFVSVEMDLGITVAYDSPDGGGRRPSGERGGWGRAFRQAADSGGLRHSNHAGRRFTRGGLCGRRDFCPMGSMLEALAGARRDCPALRWTRSRRRLVKARPPACAAESCWGLVGAIEYLIGLFKQSLGADTRVVATGGLAPSFR